MASIEIVYSGLIINGDIRDKGEVIKKPDNFPSTPREQMSRWHRVFYVEVGSKYDTSKIKKQLSSGNRELSAEFEIDVNPQLTPMGKKIMGEEEGEAPDDPDYMKTDEENEDTVVAANDIETKSTEEEDSSDDTPPALTQEDVKKMKKAELNELVERMNLQVPEESKKLVKNLKKAIIKELSL